MESDFLQAGWIQATITQSGAVAFATMLAKGRMNRSSKDRVYTGKFAYIGIKKLAKRCNSLQIVFLEAVQASGDDADTNAALQFVRDLRTENHVGVRR